MALNTLHNDWVGYRTTQSGVTLDLITKEDFEEANLGFTVPIDFTGPIAELTITNTSTTNTLLRAPSGSGIDGSLWKNVGFRYFVPESFLDTATDTPLLFRMTNGSPDFNNQDSVNQTYGTSNIALNNHGHNQFIGDPRDETTTGSLLAQFMQPTAAGGGFDISSINELQFVVNSSSGASAGTPLIIYFFDIYQDAVPAKPKVIMSFDDANLSQFTVGHASSKLSVNNIPTSYSIIPELVNGVERLTTANINEMYADNADIVGHSDSSFGDSTPPPGAPKLETDQEITDYMRDVAVPFLSQFPKNGGNHLWVWAEGVYRRDVTDPLYPELYDTLLEPFGYTAARRTNGQPISYQVTGTETPWQIFALSLGQDSDAASNAAQVSATVDQAVAMGADIAFFGHELIEPATAGVHFPSNDWPTVTADLRARADAGDIQLISLAEYAVSLGLIAIDAKNMNEWILDQGTAARGINDAWIEYLRGLGFTGHINDMQYAWWLSLGFTGSYTDRRAAWEDSVFLV